MSFANIRGSLVAFGQLHIIRICLEYWHLAVGRAVHRGLSKERSEKEGKERIDKRKGKEGETKETLLKAHRALSTLTHSTTFEILVKLKLGFVWQRARKHRTNLKNLCNNLNKSI